MRKMMIFGSMVRACWDWVPTGLPTKAKNPQQRQHR